METELELMERNLGHGAPQVRGTVEQRQGECVWAFRIVHIWLCHLLAHDLG